MLLFPIIGLVAIKAQNVCYPDLSWEQIKCQIVPKGSMDKERSSVNIPLIYKSEQYLSVQSGYANYDNVYIVISDSQGTIVKEDIMQIIAGGDNMYYIGDLDEGIYELMIESDSFFMLGLFEY